MTQPGLYHTRLEGERLRSIDWILCALQGNACSKSYAFVQPGLHEPRFAVQTSMQAFDASKGGQSRHGGSSPHLYSQQRAFEDEPGMVSEPINLQVLGRPDTRVNWLRIGSNHLHYSTAEQ